MTDFTDDREAELRARWDREALEQRELEEALGAQIKALYKPVHKKVLQRLTLLEVRCRGCGDRPFAVLMTEPCMVVRTQVQSGAVLSDGNWTLRREDWLVRREIRGFHPLHESDAPGRRVTITRRGAPVEVPCTITSACRCRTHQITEEWIWEKVRYARAGGARVVTL